MTDFDHSVPPRPFRFRAVLGAVLLLGTVVLGGCSSDDETEPEATPSATVPTPSVNVPDGVTLTEPGAELDFGETATVAYEASAQRSTVLDLTVTRVRKGSIGDLKSYVLDDRNKASTLYYVSVTVKNVGVGDLGRTEIPLYAVDGTNALIRQSSFLNSFKKCPSTRLPAAFGPGAEKKTCLVYLVPDHGTLTGVSFRPLQEFAAIVWTGELTAAAASPTKKAS